MKLKKVLKPPNSVVVNTTYLTIGSFLSQIVSLIGAFFIPRLLGPADYGAYQTVINFVGIFSLFTFSGINKVVLRECSKRPEYAKEIFEETIGLRLLFSIFAFLLCAIVAILMGYDKGTKVFIVIYSGSLLYSGLRDSVDIIYQFNRRMEFISFFSILRNTISVSLSILAVMAGYGVLTLILIQMATQGIVLLSNYRVSKKLLRFRLLSHIFLNKRIIRQGFNFSLLQFLNVLSGKIDLVMISIMGTTAEVGLYALAYNIVERGLMVRQSLSQSLFPVYAKLLEDRNLDARIVLKHTAIIALPASALCIITPPLAKWIIPVLAGENFKQSIAIINVLVYFLLFNYIVVPFGISLQANNNESIQIRIGLLTALANITLNIIFYSKYGLVGIAYSTLFTYFIHSFLITMLGYIKLKA
ncbi:MAG: flippase [Thermodesulfobacteriota bacterium]